MENNQNGRRQKWKKTKTEVKKNLTFQDGGKILVERQIGPPN